jgi:hypothetical protein
MIHYSYIQYNIILYPTMMIKIAFTWEKYLIITLLETLKSALPHTYQ